MSKWLIFIVVLVLASEWHEGPEEFASEVAIICLGLWSGMTIWRVK